MSNREEHKRKWESFRIILIKLLEKCIEKLNMFQMHNVFQLQMDASVYCIRTRQIKRVLCSVKKYFQLFIMKMQLFAKKLLKSTVFCGISSNNNHKNYSNVRHFFSMSADPPPFGPTPFF